jgi:hypothetical protein
MQDHGEWEPRGDRLVSKRGQLISVDRNRRIYYRNIDIGTRYTNSNYEKLLRFENDLEVQKKWCKKSPKLLNFASEAVQLAAVRKNGYAIQHIRDPSEAVQLAAVRQNAWLIGYIKSPSEMVKLVVMEQNRLTWFRSRPARDWTHRKRSKYLL